MDNTPNSVVCARLHLHVYLDTQMYVYWGVVPFDSFFQIEFTK